MEGAFDGLDEEIADAALRFSDAGVEGLYGQVGLRALGSHQEIADLRAIAVRHDNAVARAEDGGDGFTGQPGVATLVGETAALAPRREGIAADRNYGDRFH
jgi:hypothetical protein